MQCGAIQKLHAFSKFAQPSKLQQNYRRMVQNQTGNLLGRSIREINNLLLSGGATVRELCDESSKLINQTKNLNAFITVCDKEARTKAEELDKLVIQKTDGNCNNKLFGVPISIKDNFCTKQVLTTCGSKMLQNFIPPYDATVVRRLKQAQCLIMGKTNMDEFAMGSSSTTSFYGPTASSWNSRNKKPSESEPSEWFMAGGSSTGSAISVATGACFASLGTDTGGSTRQPASLAGVVGFKPTYGLISRFGLIPLAHCLDVVSILARTVDDVQIVFETIVGQDDNDLTSLDHKTELIAPSRTPKLRIGIPEEFIGKSTISSEVSDRFQQILNSLSASSRNITNSEISFELVQLNLPLSAFATECYTIISSTEIASNMSCYDGVKFGHSTTNRGSWNQIFLKNRDAGLGSEVKKRILLGNYFLLEGNREKYLVQALKVRRMISEEFQRGFVDNSLDIILLPSTPTTSISYETWLQKQDENNLFHEDYFLIPANLANLPSISVPAGLSEEKLPFGLQILANKFRDLDLLSIARLFEQVVLKKL